MNRIIVTNRFVPANAVAVTRWPFILVRPSHAQDQGVLAHERVHLRERDGVLAFFTWGWRYKFSRSFRLAAEVRAYRAQLTVSPGLTEEQVAVWLAWNYDLKISTSEALAALQAARNG